MRTPLFPSHRTTRRSLLPALVAAACTFLHSPTRAAGLLVADGGFGGQLEITQHDVRVTINNGIAVTEVTQVFKNLEQRQVEALYTFPVPKQASVSNFSMWIGGKEMVGEVVEKERAREIYNSYKRVRRDPGLLEQVDYKTFEMRIFPINAGAEQKVMVTYYQELDPDHNWATYVYPLATVTRDDIQAATAGPFSFTLDAKSEIPIVAMESPSHTTDFVIAPHSEHYYQASLEADRGDLSRDFVVAYKIARPKTGLDLVVSKTDAEDGYFVLTLTSGDDLEKLDVGMDFVFVLDVSGSMANQGKLRLSRESVSAFLEALGPKDRFELIAFNVRPQTLFRDLQPRSAEANDKAVQFLDSQQARGGTVLAPAVQLAYDYGDPDRPLNVVILSDGMTEQKERGTLHQLIRSRPSNARVFCIGVGNEVDRQLLRRVAEGAGGIASFISRGDNFERQAAAFRRKLTHPVAQDVKIRFAGGAVYDVEPKELPNLYHGSPLRVYGRYRKPGPVEVTLEADVRGRALKTNSQLEFPEEDGQNPEIERMWAWRVVDRLLADEGSGDAKSTRPGVDEIIRLGEEYSIVTQYTSFLVLENDAEFRRWKIERRNMNRIQRDRGSRQKLLAQLDAIRDQSARELGPEPIELAKAGAQATPAPTGQPTTQQDRRASRPQPTQGADQNRPRPRRGVDLDFGGSGPVGPAFAGLAFAILAWRRRQQHRSGRR